MSSKGWNNGNGWKNNSNGNSSKEDDRIRQLQQVSYWPRHGHLKVDIFAQLLLKELNSLTASTSRTEAANQWLQKKINEQDDKNKVLKNFLNDKEQQKR